VASQVSQRNAEEFAKKLREQGFSEARVHIHMNIRRVICGLYPTESEAYKQLKAVQQHKGLAEAWVYHVK
jgi:cell division septation protein DedD